MDKHSNTPEMSSGVAQGIDNTFSARQQTLIGLLKSGRKFSAKTLTKVTPDRDPRSTIRHLRKKGSQIGDQWVSDGGPRYKLYFLVTDEPHHGSRQLNIFSNEA